MDCCHSVIIPGAHPRQHQDEVQVANYLFNSCFNHYHLMIQMLDKQKDDALGNSWISGLSDSSFLIIWTANNWTNSCFSTQLLILCMMEHFYTLQ